MKEISTKWNIEINYTINEKCPRCGFIINTNKHPNIKEGIKFDGIIFCHHCKQKLKLEITKDKTTIKNTVEKELKKENSNDKKRNR